MLETASAGVLLSSVISGVSSIPPGMRCVVRCSQSIERTKSPVQSRQHPGSVIFVVRKSRLGNRSAQPCLLLEPLSSHHPSLRLIFVCHVLLNIQHSTGCGWRDRRQPHGTICWWGTCLQTPKIAHMRLVPRNPNSC